MSKQLKNALLTENEAQVLAETFKTMGDSTRLKIIWALLNKELCVNEIAAALGSSQSAISHQLRILRNMRLVKHQRRGQMIFYSLDDFHIKNLILQGLTHIKEL